MRTRWYLYVLVCSDGSYYTGVTTDLANRVAKHNQGMGAKYVRGRTPVRLLYRLHSPRMDKADIHRLEHRFKRLSRAGKEQFMRGEGRAYERALDACGDIRTATKISKDGPTAAVETEAKRRTP